jgi:putative nucleotidyltransferase with HDIG domain
MRFSELPLRLQLLTLVKATVALLVAYWHWSSLAATDWRLLAVLSLCAFIAGACQVDTNVRGGRITMGFTVTCFAFFALGPAAAMVVGISGLFGTRVLKIQKPRWRFMPHKALSCLTLYNSANCILGIAAMGWTYRLLGGSFGRIDLQAVAIPTLVSALVYYFANTLGVVLAIGWSQGISPITVFCRSYSWTWSGFLASASISAGMLWAYQTFAAPVALLFLPPAWLVYYSYHVASAKMRSDMDHMRDLNRLNEAVISSLAMAIDAKDRHTSSHVNRVREYAVRLAEKLRVSENELQAIRIASLLHDIGKIGIPEHILCKPGKLTPEEFEVIKTHVDIGARILEQVQFPWPVVPVVRTHHERWDGLGYPAGLQAEEIPVGGRIISLVDVYDALTSDRPYRRAIPPEQAIEILRAGSGKQFDPVVVETFVALLPEVESTIAAMEQESELDTVALIERNAQATGEEEARCSEDEARDAAIFKDLADLAGESSPLTAFAPCLAEKVSQLVPFSTFAVFLVTRDRYGVVPVHVAGLWRDLFDGMEIRLGEGASGYVAETGEPVINVAAALDLARRIRPGDNLELNSTLSVPLILDGQVVGTLTAYHSSYSFYRPCHRTRLEKAARCTTQALERAGWFGKNHLLPRESGPEGRSDPSACGAAPTPARRRGRGIRVNAPGRER